MHSAPIYLLNLNYTVRKYVMRKGKITLQPEDVNFSSIRVCIGNSIDILNDTYWNANLFSRLISDHKGKHGCEIKIKSFDVISELGLTTNRFKEREFPA